MTLSRTEIERLAAAAHALRPDWPTRSLCTWLQTDHAGAAYRDVALALAWVACDPATQTPKRMNESGPWWAATTAGGEATRPAVPRPTDPRCTVPGHEHELARACRACTADRMAAMLPATLPDPLTPTPGQAETNTRGAALVRAALTPRPTTPGGDTA